MVRMAELGPKKTDENQPETRSLCEADTCVQLLIDSLKDDAVFLLDLEGRAMSWSAGVQHVLSYGKAEFLGFPFGRLLGPDDHAAAQRQLDRARAMGRSVEDCSYVCGDGREVLVSGALTALWGPGHELRGYVSVLHDRTAEKQAAVERRELLQREHAARADATLAGRINDAFLTAVSHEIRSPLNAIL